MLILVTGARGTVSDGTPADREAGRTMTAQPELFAGAPCRTTNPKIRCRPRNIPMDSAEIPNSVHLEKHEAERLNLAYREA